LDITLLIITALAIVGGYLNSIGNRIGFAIWCVTNTGFTINNLMIGQYEQAFLFFVYLGLAINGVRNTYR
jgi:hypothetical protein